MKNKYYLRILLGGGSTERVVVEADFHSIREGYYSFRKDSVPENGVGDLIANYPIDNTIIEQIEES